MHHTNSEKQKAMTSGCGKKEIAHIYKYTNVKRNNTKGAFSRESMEWSSSVIGKTKAQRRRNKKNKIKNNKLTIF